MSSIISGDPDCRQSIADKISSIVRDRGSMDRTCLVGGDRRPVVGVEVVVDMVRAKCTEETDMSDPWIPDP